VFALSETTTTRVHLVNPLWDMNGGSEHRTVATWRLLQPFCDVRLWSEYGPAPQLAATLPIRRIAPLTLSIPFGGTLVFMGVYFRIGHWVRFTRPKRVIVVYNTDQPDRLAKNLGRIESCGTRAEVVATSAALAKRVGQPLPLLESPIDLAPFLAVDRPARTTFTVGRLSRDDTTKHHDEDADLYRLLAAIGCRVRIMGGTCLASRLAGISNIELLPAGAEDPATFLSSLDCFYYRTNERWFEGFGRVVFEAMASGLPVVCSARGGYADYLDMGRDSLVFETTAQAMHAILDLRANPLVRVAMGAAARRSARRIVGEGLHARTRRFLLPAAVDMPSCSAGVVTPS
jgi:glycosyltransferase involved in cell wall biosynthesis